MGKTLVTVETLKCDECAEEFTGAHVDAMVYGVVFHPACWEKIGGPRVARVLYLDDIYHYDASGERCERAMGPRQ